MAFSFQFPLSVYASQVFNGFFPVVARKNIPAIAFFNTTFVHRVYFTLSADLKLCAYKQV